MRERNDRRTRHGRDPPETSQLGVSSERLGSAGLGSAGLGSAGLGSAGLGSDPPDWLRLALLLAAGALLLAGAYLLLARALLPSQLRGAAERAGVGLSFDSLRSFHPGRISVDELQLYAPGLEAVLHAKRVNIDTSWRSVFSERPLPDVVRASQVELRWAGGELGPFDVTVRFFDETAAAHRSGWLEIDGPRTALTTSSSRSELALQARLHVTVPDLEGDSARVALGKGSIQASNVVVDSLARERGRPSPHGAPFDAMLRVETGAIMFSRGLYVLGRAHVRGQDASAAIARADAPAALQPLLLDLSERPFELEASVHACARSLEIEQIRFEAGITEATGALHAGGGGLRGALVMRRGSLEIAISVLPSGVSARPAPEPYWLAAELARIDRSCFGAGF